MSSLFRNGRDRIFGFMVLTLSAAAFMGAGTSRDRFQGNVMAAGHSALMIESAPDYDLILFRVESQTQILKDGEKVALREIESGDSVVVEATARDNERIAATIVAHTPY